jgi:hypothetical protein
VQDEHLLNKMQTLRFVKSLPKRERQPLANKFKNADADGMFLDWNECLNVALT